jgi:LacI family transcriptional regulator
MREKVMAAVEELGYRPNLLASGMRSQMTHSVGFVAGDISNPLIAEILKGAETALRDAGYATLVTNSEGDPQLDIENIRILEQRLVDGLLVSVASEGHRRTLAALRNAEVPVVSIDRNLPASVRASFVLSDHRAGMRAAVDHLLDLGHRRIGLISGAPVRPSLEREAGLRDAYTNRGLPPMYDILGGAFGAKHAEMATAALLEGSDPPTAIVAGGNQLLIGTLRAITDRRLELGRDLSLISCDVVALTDLYRPPIAVIKRELRLMGEEAAQMFLKRMNGAEPATVVLPTEFIPRASCGPPTRQRDRGLARFHRPAGDRRTLGRQT